MEGFKLRPYVRADAQGVADVINVSSLQTVGFPRAVVDAAGNIWAYRFVPFSSTKTVATDATNQVVGYAYLTSEDDNIVAEMGASVHPAHRARGIGSALLEWAEGQARDSSLKAPTGVRTVLQTSLYPAERDAIKLFEDHGYTPVREWVHLVVEMNDRPPSRCSAPI